jgi:hypothetical protein
MEQLGVVQKKEEMLNAIFVRGHEYFHREGDFRNGQVSIYSHIGSRRAQEDALYFGDCISKNKIFFAAADGLGRYNGGAEAARVCIDALHETIVKFDGEIDPQKLPCYIRMKMRDHKTIMHDEKLAGGACMTIAEIDLERNQVEFYSMGDTLGFVENASGEIVFETQVDKKSSGSNGVTRALTPQLTGLNFHCSGKYQLSPGDKIHCMSDGVEVENIINDSDIRVSKKISHYFGLIDNAKNLNILNQDNTSIVSFELNQS